MVRFIMLLIVLSLFASCYKTLPGGIDVTVTGFVVDTVKTKYLPKATVIVWGCNGGMFSSFCDSVTSAKTDADGKFALNFTTDGKYAWYSAAVEPMADDRYTNDYYGNPDAAIKMGENKNVRLKARELNILWAKITILENPFDTLLISNYYSMIWIYNHRRIDTILSLQVLPMCLNHIGYSIWDSKHLKYRTLKDTMTVNMADTTFYTRVFNTSLDFPLE
jgi:hypothetical protein